MENFVHHAVQMCFLTALFVLAGCTKTIHLKVPGSSNVPVINCLFSPDSSWSVYVGRSGSTTKKDSVNIIDDAQVIIYGNDDSISLRYDNNGYYISDKKPRAGIPYHLLVKAPGYPPITATDRIPAAHPEVEKITFDTIPAYFTPDNAFENIKVFQIKMLLRLPFHDEQYYRLSAFSYDIDESSRFVVTAQTIRALREYGMTETYLEHLKTIQDITYSGKTKFLQEVKKTTGTSGWNYAVYAYSKKIPRSPATYRWQMFDPIWLFCKSIRYYNITGDSHSVFGAYPQAPGSLNDSATLYIEDIADHVDIVNNIPKIPLSELWVYIYSISPAMYRYQSTYIKQLLNAQNPLSEPVQVYSNIEHGIGIFAGYQTQRIKVYE